MSRFSETPVYEGAMQNGSFNDTYTAQNQMFGYAYDAAGNLLADGLGDVFTWDAKGRLSSAGGATYVYDPLGNRVGKQGVGLTDTIYFGGRPIARNSAGQWTDLIYKLAGGGFPSRRGTGLEHAGGWPTLNGSFP